MRLSLISQFIGPLGNAGRELGDGLTTGLEGEFRVKVLADDFPSLSSLSTHGITENTFQN